MNKMEGCLKDCELSNQTCLQVEHRDLLHRETVQSGGEVHAGEEIPWSVLEQGAGCLNLWKSQGIVKIIFYKLINRFSLSNKAFFEESLCHLKSNMPIFW